MANGSGAACRLRREVADNRCYVKNITSFVKKNHVVRKLFYVASIFSGAAGRKNRPPWKKFEAVS